MKKIKRIVLFKFHKEFEICKNRLEILRKFNPDIPIYGLYGGQRKDYKNAKKLDIPISMIPSDDWYWKWRNGDLSLRWWYKQAGHKIDFDMLHVFEWDLILFDSVENYFRDIKNGIAMSNVQLLAPIYDHWIWTAEKLGRIEYLELIKLAKKKFKYRKKALAGNCGGLCLSKKFLEEYSRIDEMPSLCNDEVRLLLFAQCFNMKVRNLKIPSKKFFNADQNEVSPKEVLRAYKKGVKLFHPVRQKLILP